MSLVPSDLTIPDAGSQTARQVLSAAIRRLLADLSRLPVGRARREVQRAHQKFARLLASNLRKHPGAVTSVLRRPNVAALIRCLRSCPRPGIDIDDLLIELHATVVVELATAGILDGATLDLVPSTIVCLGGRQRLTTPPETKSVTVERCGVLFVTPSGRQRQDFCPDEQVFATIAGTEIVLSLADNNPLSDFEAHPDKQGNQIDLGGRAPSEWTRVLGEALECIGTHLPDLRHEIELYIHQIIPVGFDAQRHLSASYQEAIGTIYLTLHPQSMTMVEAVIHEFSHNKINALFEIDAVLENAYAPLFRSPIRPDPRPLHGILLAVHAFLPVARLYEQILVTQEHPDVRRRFSQIVRSNHDGASVLLEHAVATPVGRGVLDEIARWDRHFAS